MKIVVKVKDIKIKINDKDTTAVVKYESHNKEIHKTIKIMCEEANSLLIERHAIEQDCC